MCEKEVGHNQLSDILMLLSNYFIYDDRKRIEKVLN